MKRSAVPYILILSIMLMFSACSTEYDAHYDKLMQSVYRQGQFNGNILVFKEGKIVYRGSFGIADINTNDSLHLRSRFRLASVSKQFTAAGIIKLQEAGKLSYEQDIREFIPELPYDGISVRHLLNHTSGIPDYERLLNENWKPELAKNDPTRLISGNIDIINVLVDKHPPLHFEPGEKYEYSNTGYVLLASIIERVSGKTFGEFLKEQIFDLAEMTNTCVYKYVHEDESMPNRVYGFKKTLNGKDLISTDCHYINPVLGDGGIYSTLEDLLKWDRILYGNDILSGSSKNEAFSPAILNNGDTSWYGFGWGIKTSPTGKKVLEHSGGWVGFRTYFYREIEENNCIIILTNHSSKYMWDIVNELKHILHDHEWQIPKITIAEKIAPVLLDQGIDSAIALFKDLHTNNVNDYNFDEYYLRSLGYNLLNMDLHHEALQVFLLNRDMYPASARVYDCLSNAYQALGDTLNTTRNKNKAQSLRNT